MQIFKPLVSIIVPVFKVEPFLKKCVSSIINQTYNFIEIILVDDGSPDNCPQICDKLANEDGRIKVVHQKNMGLPYARRSGYAISKGDYIFFVDSDDYIDKDCIKILVSHAIDSDADIILSGIYNVSNKEQYVVPRLKPGIYDKKAIKELLSKDFLFNKNNKASSYPLYAWGKLIKRGVMDGYFEVSTQFRYWEDMPSTFYLTKKINSLQVVENNLYFYVIHANQVTQKPIENIWHYYVDVWTYLEKTDTEGYLKTQLPQRIWWVIINGLDITIKKNNNYRHFKRLFQTIRDTPIIQRNILDAKPLEPLAPTYKILHLFFKKKWSKLYFIIVKYNLISNVKNLLRLK